MYSLERKLTVAAVVVQSQREVSTDDQYALSWGSAWRMISLTCSVMSMICFSTSPVLTSRPSANLSLCPMGLCQRHRWLCMRQQLESRINPDQCKALHRPPARQLQLVQRLTAERSEKRSRTGALRHPLAFSVLHRCPTGGECPVLS